MIQTIKELWLLLAGKSLKHFLDKAKKKNTAKQKKRAEKEIQKVEADANKRREKIEEIKAIDNQKERLQKLSDIANETRKER